MRQKVNENIKESGRIISYFSGIAKVQGLPHVFLHEILLDNDDREVGIVIGFDEHVTEVLIFEESFDYAVPVYRSRRLFSIPVSEACLGRVVDGFGRTIDGMGDLQGDQRAVFNEAPSVIQREPVSMPLTTGIKIIDAALPLGRGQRELIIGDRGLGKSAIALNTVLNQKYADPPVYCIYVLCGERREKLQEIVALFKKENALLYTTIVAATASDSFAAQYLAPFIGCTLGEHFRDAGKDAIIIYDDLSKHAKTYRDISLLLERAPGREAYPGDIFSLHATLLERSAKLSEKKGGGSLSALPIVETQEGDITSFIPTNLISITDGQIYLERGLYQRGFLPAVNVGLSVSRVGSQAQSKSLAEVTGGIRLILSQYKELQKLIQMETAVSEEAQSKIRRGTLLIELLKQEKYEYIGWEEQVILFYSIEEGFFDDIIQADWHQFEKLLLEMIRNRYPNILERLKTNSFDKELKDAVKEIIIDFKHEFLS